MKLSYAVNIVLSIVCIGLTVWAYLLNDDISEKDAALESMHVSLSKANDRLIAQPWWSTRYLERFRFVTPAGIDHERIFSKKLLVESGITDREEFVKEIWNRFEQHAAELERAWDINDRDLLWAYFSMNLVSRMWGFGNRDPALVDEVGCVSQNEDTGFVRSEELTLSDYIASEIGCCSDYAELLEILLSSRGIRNRKIFDGNHVFNEAWIGGRFQVFDANLNLSIDRPWSEIERHLYQAPNSITVTLFPHHNMIEHDNPHFRPALGQFRMQWLLRLTKKISANATVGDSVELPAETD